MKIIISEAFGTRCMIASEGQKLHDMVSKSLQSGEDVTLDFSGVKQFASPFFNYSIGQLLNNIHVDQVRTRLHLENLDSIGRLVVERVIENASQYHVDEDYKRIVDSILEHQSKGLE